MTEEFTPNVQQQISETEGPTLEQQAQEMGIQQDEQGEYYQGDPVPVEPDTPILGKFQDYEQLEQAYTNLEYQQSQRHNPDPSAVMTQASEYFQQYGELSDEHYSALGQTGLNRQYVDSYIAGIQAQGAQQSSEYFAQVGGEENYQQMAGWMTEQLPSAEIEGYNRIMNNGSFEEVSVLMQGMYARYMNATEDPYQQLQGGPAQETAVGFESRGQVMAFLDDPRYETDSSFRDEFEYRLAHTSEDVF